MPSAKWKISWSWQAIRLAHHLCAYQYLGELCTHLTLPITCRSANLQLLNLWTASLCTTTPQGQEQVSDYICPTSLPFGLLCRALIYEIYPFSWKMQGCIDHIRFPLWQTLWNLIVGILGSGQKRPQREKICSAQTTHSIRSRHRKCQFFQLSADVWR